MNAKVFACGTFVNYCVIVSLCQEKRDAECDRVNYTRLVLLTLSIICHFLQQSSISMKSVRNTNCS